MPLARPSSRRSHLAALAALAVALAACAAPEGSAAPDGSAAPPAGPAAPEDADASRSGAMIYGVTVDDPWRAAETAEAIAALPRAVMARVVFDEGMAAAEYVDPVRRIAGAGAVMGEILDSFYMPGITADGYRARTREYLAALGDTVSVWEVGNEVNGDWLGSTADVVAKVRAASEEVRAAGKPTALTLFGCSATAENEMLRWAEANLDPDLRASLDHVWVSFYEDDCADPPPDWDVAFRRLGELFPNATLGFGECGTRYPERKLEYLRRWYTTVPDAPRFVGGYFWWYFSEDMVPMSSPLFGALAEILAAAP
jgi:hypothetical protein